MSPSSRQIVCKANALIEARYRLSTVEHRLLLACIAQIRRNDQSLTDEELYTVTALEIAESADIPRQVAYRDLQAAVERLFERYVRVPYGPDGSSQVAIRKFRWVQEVVYRQEEGRVQLRFSKPVLPYLNQLTRQFTTYHLRDVAKMTSSHAIRFYELMMQWRQAGERTVEVDWLKQTFQIEDKYKSIRDLKRFVIDIAIEQINTYSPMWIKWEQIKTGRRVTAFRFTFGPKNETGAVKSATSSASGSVRWREKNMPVAEERILGIPKREIERRAFPGETYEQAAARITRDAKGR